MKFLESMIQMVGYAILTFFIGMLAGSIFGAVLLMLSMVIECITGYDIVRNLIRPMF